MKKSFKKINNNFYLVDFPQKTEDIYFDVYLKTGYSSESDNEFGTGHFLEHYLIESATDKMKLTNGSIGQDFTNFYFKSDSKRILEDIEIFLNTILKPNFDNDKLFKREKEVIENEVRAKKNIKETAFNFILKKCFGDDFPCSREKTDQIKNIKKIKLDNLQGYHSKVFCDENVFFVLSGFSIDNKIENGVVNILKKYSFSNNKTDKIAEYKFFGEKVIKSSKYYWNDELALNAVFGLSETIRGNSKNALAIAMIKRYFESPDFSCAKNMRELGLYSGSFDRMAWRNAGMIVLSAVVDKNKINAVLEEFFNCIEKIKKEGIAEKDLVKLKKKEKEIIINSFDNNTKRLSWIVINQPLNYPNYGIIKSCKKKILENYHPR